MPRPKHEADPSVPLPQTLSGERPKGEELDDILRSYVEELSPGQHLPSERTLAERLNVARMTVRQALNRLSAEGLVYQRRGQGTFAAGPRLVHSESLISFSDDMRARGLKPGARVVSASVHPAEAQLAARLQVREGAPVVHLVRVRTADDVPIALERPCLPADRFPGLDQADLNDVTLYEYLEQTWNVRAEYGEQKVSVLLPDPADADLLKIPPTLPCFLIERVSYDRTGHVVEGDWSLYRGDRYDLLMRVRRERRQTEHATPARNTA
jgi:GntR family transcriptional regulator